MDRELDDFWWTWMEGQDWPSWYYAEKMAREAAAVLARGNPGRKVSVGKLERAETILLPDQLTTVAG